MSENKLKVVFAPGCFDEFDGTQEELDELVTEINRMVESGEIFEKSEPLNLDEILDEMSEEDIFEILTQIESENSGNTRH
jgi:hypothetical protein